MLIWQVLDGLLHHLFLMMIHDFPLEIRKKKKGVHIGGDRGSFGVFGALEFFFGALDRI